jgi:hypothetical protein
VRKDFKIPKFHAMLHYVESIRLFGTTDNYNTETFERLHIDFTKEGWRASNRRDEFPQMIRWLSRQEKIAAFHRHVAATPVNAYATGSPPSASSIPRKPPISIAKNPSHEHSPLKVVEDLHCALDFTHYLKVFMNKITNSSLRPSQLDQANLPFTRVNVYDCFRFHPESIQDEEVDKDIVKAIRTSKRLPQGRFDTVVVMVNEEAESTALKGRISQLATDAG